MQTRIHKNTFKGCTKLASIKLPTGISAIDDEAFRDCASLVKAEIGTDVTFIGLSAFNGCSSLTDVDRFSDTNSSHTFDMVGNHAFANAGLKDIKLALRSDVINTFWGDNCFASCDNLTDVHILSANYLSKEMFKDCKQLSSVKFDVNMMAYMYPKVFENCQSLTSVTLPSKALYIPEEMFKNCRSLQNVNFTNYDANNSGVELIQRNAFYGCDSLRSIQIPATISSLDQIEDASLSGNSCTDVTLHGIKSSLIGLIINPKIKDSHGSHMDILYHTSLLDYYFNNTDMTSGCFTLEQLIEVFRLAAYFDIPIIYTIEFVAGYWTNCNFPTFYNFTFLPYKNYLDKKFFANVRQYYDKYSNHLRIKTDNVSYRLNNKKILILNIPVYIDTDSNYAYEEKIMGDGSVNDEILKYLEKSKEQYNKKNYKYNVLTYLCRYKSCIISTSLSRAPRFICGILNWKKSSKNTYLEEPLNSANIKYYKYIRINVNNAFKNYDIITNDNINDLIINDFFQTTKFKKSFWPSVKDSNEAGIEVPMSIVSNEIKNTEMFRLLNSNKTNATIYCSDDIHYLTYTQGSPYTNPISYVSDKNTKTNFEVGKWYYNAKELHKYARQHNTPCLFIYSMLGCGPCQIYSRNIWNNSSFQKWCKKQKFYLCGIECDSQPFYDTSLQFCSDLSKTAENFINVGESSSMKQKNQFDEQFSRIMTPVLIFMDKDGKCYDYTYHSIQNQIHSWGVDGVIQCLKSLCLYHFDNNDLYNTDYVVDANKIFMIGDYVLLDPDNPWKIADNLMDLGKSDLNTVEDVENDIIDTLDSLGHSYNGLYLGGCLILDIEYLYLAFSLDPDFDSATTANQLNIIYSKMFFRIGNKYYKLQANSSDYKTIDDPCGTGKVKIFKTTFVEVQYILQS